MWSLLLCEEYYLKLKFLKAWLFLQGKGNSGQVVAELLTITSLSLAVGRKSK